MNILEVGGGTGRNSIYFSQRGIAVLHLDVSDAAISLLCTELANTKYQDTISAMRIDFFEAAKMLREANFDGVFSNFCMHLLSNKQRRRFIDIAVKLLKPGGVLILSLLSTADSDYCAAQEDRSRSPSPKFRTFQVRGNYQHFFDEHEARTLLQRPQLSLVELTASLELELIVRQTRKTSFWTAVAKKGEE